MKKSTTLLFTLIIMIAAATVACENGDTQSDQQPTDQQAQQAQQGEPAQEQQAAEEPAKEEPGASEEVLAHIKDAASAYDKIRAKLVEDSTEGIKEQAAKVQKQAASAQKEATGELAPKLEKLATQAEQFQELPEDADIAEVREAFGALSQALVAVVSDVPALQDDLHIYKCGMAKGYAKWVQLSEEKGNPYMGQKMPMCGAPSDWSA